MIEVLRPGVLDLVMDLGRPGFRAQGVPEGGAADVPALILANRLVGNPDQAAGLELLLRGPRLRFPQGGRVALAESPLAGWAREAGIEVLEEAFADRRYLSSGMLAPRRHPGAVIYEPAEVRAQAQKIAAGLALETQDGGLLRVRADTLCLHGEGPRAAELVRMLGEMLRGG